MLYTASFFQPENHHGQVFSIARSQPKGFNFPQLSFLAPSEKLLNSWKYENISEETYTSYYRQEIAANWTQVKRWLDSLDSAVDITLLCWEKTGLSDGKSFCHRNLVGLIVQKWRADCWGGSDVLYVAPADPVDPHTPEQLTPEETGIIAPYPIGSQVALQCCPKVQYEVLKFIDLDKVEADGLKLGRVCWHYTLRRLDNSKTAYWEHHHLIAV